MIPHFYKPATLFITGVLSLATAVFGQNERNPNVLVIMTDQQAWNAVGYAGNKMIKTPNLDTMCMELRHKN